MTKFCDSVSSTLQDENGVTATGETFAHNDGSWPCLRGINLSDIDATDRAANLHYIVPSGYFDDATDSSFHMSLQTIPVGERAHKTKTQGFPTYTLFNGYNRPSTGDQWRYFLAEQRVAYDSEYPHLEKDTALGVGSVCYKVDSCADTNFNPPDTSNWPQFAFTATVPAGVYGGSLKTNTSIVNGTDSANCILNTTVDCSDSLTNADVGEGLESNMGDYTGGCLTQTMGYNATQGNSGVSAFGRSACLCLNNDNVMAPHITAANCMGGSAVKDTQIASDQGDQQICDTTNSTEIADTNDQMAAVPTVPRTYVSANFRDGYQRLQAENVVVGEDGRMLLPVYLEGSPDTQCYGNGNGDTVSFLQNFGDTGQLYTGYIKPDSKIQGPRSRGLNGNSDPYNVPDQVQFTSTNTCAPPPKSMEDQNALIMMDVDRYDSAEPVRRVFTNLEWVGSGPKPLFAQSNGDYVQSFNVVARMPTCLDESDANPTESTSRFSSSEYRSVSCYDTDQPYNPWAWRKPVDLGYSKGSYTGGAAGAWNAVSFANWPAVNSTETVSETHPDIVVRLAFANTKVLDPATGNPVPLATDDPSFQDHVIALWSQNAPGNALTKDSTLSQTFLTADMCAVAFYEYVANTMYRDLFASYLTTSGVTGNPVNRWYSVANNLIQTGIYGQYDATQYIHDYFTAFVPAYSLPRKSSSTSLESMLTELSQDLVLNASSYFRYPRFRLDADNVLWVDFYCDLYTHLNLLNGQGGTIQQYLRNMYQDSGLAYIQSGTSVLMAPRTTSTAPDIVLRGTEQHIPENNLIWTGSTDNIRFTTSYAWTQKVSKLSAVPVIWMGLMHRSGTGTAPDWLSWMDTTGWNTLSQFVQTGVPRLLALAEIDAVSEGNSRDVYTNCLSTKPLTYACAEKLCPSSSLNGCLCDYSITLDTVTMNPGGSVYFNNSNGACACLANPSYPVGASNNYRAWNPVTLCFSQACLDYSFPTEEAGIQCEQTGCSSFTASVDRAQTSLSDGTWTSGFGSQGQFLNVDEIAKVCNMTLEVEEATDQQLFFWNWYAVATGICLASIVPVYVGLDYAMRRTSQTPTVYMVFGILGIVLTAIGGLLVYALSGVRSCVNPETGRPEYDYDDVTQGRCVDRLTGAIDLSPDACNGAAAAFCQCAKEETTCNGYFNGNGTCSANHMCCVCANSCFTNEIVTGTVSLGKDKVSTSLLLLGVAGFLLLSAVIVTTVPAALGRETKKWDGGKFVSVPGHSTLIQWLVAGILLATVAIGSGLGIYYGSQALPVTAHQIHRQLQEEDLSSNTVCGALV